MATRVTNQRVPSYDKRVPSYDTTTHLSRSVLAWGGISVIPCWDLSTLTTKGRVGLGVDVVTWMRTSIDRLEVELLRLNPEIAVRAYRLREPLHPDSAGRLIVATPMENGCALVASDRGTLEHTNIATVH